MKPLNCGDCTFCCHDTLVIVMDKEQFPFMEIDTITSGTESHSILKSKPNGDCIYLDKTKSQPCTIYKNRPVMCQVYDCRGFYQSLKKRGRKIPAELEKVAKAAIKRSNQEKQRVITMSNHYE